MYYKVSKLIVININVNKMGIKFKKIKNKIIYIYIGHYKYFLEIKPIINHKCVNNHFKQFNFKMEIYNRVLLYAQILQPHVINIIEHAK